MKEIGLEEVINQVKRELLRPNPSARAQDPYPLFTIDKIELEIATQISKSGDGSIKFTVLDSAEIDIGIAVSKERMHIVRVSLSPILSREDIVAGALKDDQIRNMAMAEARKALVRHDEGLKGEPE